MVQKMSTNPAKVLGMEDRKGYIKEGMDADIVVFNPNVTEKIDTASFASKGKNTPFQGTEVKGVVAVTIVNGKVVYKR